MNRAYPQNIEVLEQILACRHRLAGLLGHKNWAAHVTEDKMILTDEAVDRFVNEIAGISRGRSKRDYRLLLERKQRDLPEAQKVVFNCGHSIVSRKCLVNVGSLMLKYGGG